MDLGNHHLVYVFEQRKNTNTNRKLKVSISYKDFNCFEPMGFAHVHFFPFDFSNHSFKKLTSEKRHFRTQNKTKHNVNILTSPNHYGCVFCDRPKTNDIKDI